MKRCEDEANGRRCHITIIPVEDDTDIPWLHIGVLYWHAASATRLAGISYEELEREKETEKADLGLGGWVGHGLADKARSNQGADAVVRGSR